MDPEVLAAAVDAQDQVARLIIADLSKPFREDQIKHRKLEGTGKELSYLETMTVVERLNEVCPRWDFRVTEQTIHPFGFTGRGSERLLLRATGELTVPEVGTRAHTGVQVVNANDGGEDLWKGAISDALKKAATLLGVGAYLYFDAPLYSDSEPVSTMPQQMSQPRPQAAAPQQHASPSAGAGGISQSQMNLLMRLAYERGYTYDSYKDAGALSKAEASSIIDTLMKEQRINPLQKDEMPPNEWYGIPY